MNKYLKIGGIMAGSIVVLLLIAAFGFKYAVNTGQLTYWDGKWYTKAQLEKAFPPQYYDTPAKNTPEEVYTAFRGALLANDKERALESMSDYRKKDYREALNDNKRFQDWLKTLPETIIKESVDGNFANYYYINFSDQNDKKHHRIEYRKNLDGYWLIDQI